MSKFVTEDIDLFKDLLEDIFSVKDPPKKVYKAEETQVRKLLREYNLVEEPLWFMRIFQLFETQDVRHGFMLVGTAGSGKSTIMNILTEAMTELGRTHQMTKMNPKAITS